MTTHIFPDNLKPYVSHKEGEDMIELDKKSFFKGTLSKENLIRPGSTIYSSFMASEIDDFTTLFLDNHETMSKNHWVGVIRHGVIGFQIYAMIGCLRLILSHGGKVSAMISDDIKEMYEYYNGILTTDKFQIPLSVSGGEPISNQAPTPSVVVAPAISSSVPESDKSTSVLSMDKPIFEENQGRLVENNFSQPYWNDWERDKPHSQIRANYAGFPFYVNPPVMLSVANMIEYIQPSVAIDLNAYKFGMTAFMAQITSYANTVVLGINSDNTHDDELFGVLKTKPWAENIQKTSWNLTRPESLHLDPFLIGCESAFIFVNLHMYEPVMAVVNSIVEKVNKAGFIFHAENHMDMPRIISDVEKISGMRKVVSIYRPPGGTWCENGMFVYTKPGS